MTLYNIDIISYNDNYDMWVYWFYVNAEIMIVCYFCNSNSLFCDYALYVITPKMKGVYSIAEAVMDSCMRSEKTVFCYLKLDEDETFDEHQLKSLEATKQMIYENGANVFDSLLEVADFLNFLNNLD